MKKNLYRYTLDCGRMGTVEGMFVATPGTVRKAIGKRCCFGEILGKHSEIVTDLAESQFEIVTDDQDFVSKFEEFKCSSGYNPLHYLDGN